MPHPIAAAALAVGFFDVKPATGHPFGFWRETMDRIPFGKIFSLEHRPEALSGWPAETTIWSATMAAPPFTPWPAGYGEVSGYYAALCGIQKKEAAWAQAVRDMGYEVCEFTSQRRLPARAAAIRAGLGIPGLFGPMITPRHGSFVYIGTILVRMAPLGGSPWTGTRPLAKLRKMRKLHQGVPRRRDHERRVRPDEVSPQGYELSRRHA